MALSKSNSVSVYRYKLNDEIMELITKFAKIHQYDDRKSYKESWKLWVEKNSETLNREKNRLKDIGYKGSVEDKMFKSGRYYFRKKPVETKEKQKEKQERRNYISMDHTILDAMDEHISNSMKNDNFSPASGYNNFCKENFNLLKDEICRICENNEITTEDITSKIKKTYKNRYFLISKNY